MSCADVVTTTPKARQESRTLALDEGTVAALKKYRALQFEERMLLGIGAPSEDDIVFTNADTSPIHPERFSRAFERIVARSPLPRIRLHDLRHSYAPRC
jgi:integrase